MKDNGEKCYGQLVRVRAAASFESVTDNVSRHIDNTLFYALLYLLWRSTKNAFVRFFSAGAEASLRRSLIGCSPNTRLVAPWIPAFPSYVCFIKPMTIKSNIFYMRDSIVFFSLNPLSAEFPRLKDLPLPGFPKPSRKNKPSRHCQVSLSRRRSSPMALKWFIQLRNFSSSLAEPDG